MWKAQKSQNFQIPQIPTPKPKHLQKTSQLKTQKLVHSSTPPLSIRPTRDPWPCSRLPSQTCRPRTGGTAATYLAKQRTTKHEGGSYVGGPCHLFLTPLAGYVFCFLKNNMSSGDRSSFKARKWKAPTPEIDMTVAYCLAKPATFN